MKYFIFMALLCASFDNYAQQADTSKHTAIALDSVVVLNNGYQSIPKDRATGSFSHVDNKTLNLQVGGTVLGRLESVTPSLAVAKKAGGMPPVTIRGLSTINGSTAPLIILDNFPYEGDINSINPNMVESITILKDATAASIWGTRAGNGVIVINTKKGKYYQPFTIDFSSSTQVTSKPDLDLLHTISPADYVGLEQFLYSKGYYASQLSANTHPVISPVVDLLDRQTRGLVGQMEVNDAIARFKHTDIKNELSKYYYTGAINQQYAINFSGGSPKMAWLAGAGYDHNISSLAEKTERKNLRFENNFTPLKNLKVISSVYFNGSTNKTGKDDYGTQDYLSPYSSLFKTDGNPTPFPRNYRSSYTDTLYTGKLLDWGYYPTENFKHRFTETKNISMLFNTGLQYQFGNGFSVEGKYQYERQHIQRRTLSDEQSYNARYIVNLYSQVNTSTGVVTYNLPQGGILDLLNSDLVANNYRLQVNYSRKWGAHQLNAFAGNEIRDIHNTDESYRTYGYNSNLATGSVTDFKSRFPTITNGDLLMIPGGENLFTDQLKRYVSFYGNAAYTYNNRYSVTASARRDASNLFGISTNQKWTPLWSVGAGWLVSNATFYRSGLISYLKLRATYGYTGNADPTRSGVVTVYANGNSSVTGLTTYRIRQFPNPDLKWEQVLITNFAVDFASRNNRISGSVEYYRKKGVDLFANTLIDLTTGISGTGVTKNIANMKGSGLDLTLHSINTKGNIKWMTDFLFSYNTDRVTESFLLSSSGIYYVSDGSAYGSVKDRPVHSVMSLRWGGLDPMTGNPQGYLNGKLSTDYTALTSTALTLDDLEYSGPGLPQYFGSVTNSFTFKKFEVNFNISYKFRYFFKRKALNYSSLFFNDRMGTSDYASRWQKPGDEAFTDIPSLVYPNVSNRDNFYTSSTAVVEKGDHIRLQFINLSYRFKINRAGVEKTQWKMMCFLNASNLGIIWRANKHGLDPDYATNSILPSKAVAFGVKLFFQ